MIISGGRHLGTSWSWATKLKPVLLVPLGGSADPTWLVMKLAGYLSLGYSTIIQGVGGSPFCPGHILRCVHSHNTETQAYACTIAVGINKPSVDAPSAMAEVLELITTPQKP